GGHRAAPIDRLGTYISLLILLGLCQGRVFAMGAKGPRDASFCAFVIVLGWSRPRPAQWLHFEHAAGGRTTATAGGVGSGSTSPLISSRFPRRKTTTSIGALAGMASAMRLNAAASRGTDFPATSISTSLVWMPARPAGLAGSRRMTT